MITWLKVRTQVMIAETSRSDGAKSRHAREKVTKSLMLISRQIEALWLACCLSYPRSRIQE
jgi:hypothetical protein